MKYKSALGGTSAAPRIIMTMSLIWKTELTKTDKVKIKCLLSLGSLYDSGTRTRVLSFNMQINVLSYIKPSCLLIYTFTP